jgi:ribosomal protein S18 acetylase RimI-like enzyme
MQHIQIIRATKADITALQQIGRQTFFETFAASNTASDMQQYLDEKFSTEQISSELDQPASEFYLALQSDTVIGYLKINGGSAQTELRDGQSLEIERIYVLNAFHGKKIGQLLFSKALDVAREQQKSSIWLGVWEQNTRAIRFYEKNGFVPFDKHIFQLGDDAQTDIMMRKELD